MFSLEPMEVQVVLEDQDYVAQMASGDKMGQRLAMSFSISGETLRS